MQMALLALLDLMWQALWPLAVIYLIVSCIERLWPGERGQSGRATLVSVQYVVVYNLIIIFMMVGGEPLRARALELLGGGWIKPQFGASFGGRLIQYFGYLLVFDFFYYWMHRLQHAWRILWQQHKLHHAQPFNVTATGTHHWLEYWARLICIYVPMGVVFDLRMPEIGVLGIILGYHDSFVHWNIRLNLGPLTPVILGPHLHHIHHSNRPEHADRNFASFFPIWDILFGTYYWPGEEEYPNTGLHSGERPRNLWHANIWPFLSWLEMVRQADRARREKRLLAGVTRLENGERRA